MSNSVGSTITKPEDRIVSAVVGGDVLYGWDSQRPYMPKGSKTSTISASQIGDAINLSYGPSSRTQSFVAVFGVFEKLNRLYSKYSAHFHNLIAQHIASIVRFPTTETEVVNSYGTITTHNEKRYVGGGPVKLFLFPDKTGAYVVLYRPFTDANNEDRVEIVTVPYSKTSFHELSFEVIDGQVDSALVKVTFDTYVFQMSVSVSGGVATITKESIDAEKARIQNVKNVPKGTVTYNSVGRVASVLFSTNADDWTGLEIRLPSPAYNPTVPVWLEAPQMKFKVIFRTVLYDAQENTYVNSSTPPNTVSNWVQDGENAWETSGSTVTTEMHHTEETLKTLTSPAISSIDNIPSPAIAYSLNYRRSYHDDSSSTEIGHKTNGFARWISVNTSYHQTDNITCSLRCYIVTSPLEVKITDIPAATELYSATDTIHLSGSMPMAFGGSAGAWSQEEVLTYGGWSYTVDSAQYLDVFGGKHRAISYTQTRPAGSITRNWSGWTDGSSSLGTATYSVTGSNPPTTILVSPLEGKYRGEYALPELGMHIMSLGIYMKKDDITIGGKTDVDLHLFGDDDGSYYSETPTYTSQEVASYSPVNSDSSYSDSNIGTGVYSGGWGTNPLQNVSTTTSRLDIQLPDDAAIVKSIFDYLSNTYVVLKYALLICTAVDRTLVTVIRIGPLMPMVALLEQYLTTPLSTARAKIASLIVNYITTMQTKLNQYYTYSDNEEAAHVALGIARVDYQYSMDSLIALRDVLPTTTTDEAYVSGVNAFIKDIESKQRAVLYTNTSSAEANAKFIYDTGLFFVAPYYK